MVPLGFRAGYVPLALSSAALPHALVPCSFSPPPLCLPFSGNFWQNTFHMFLVARRYLTKVPGQKAGLFIMPGTLGHTHTRTQPHAHTRDTHTHTHTYASGQLRKSFPLYAPCKPDNVNKLQRQKTAWGSRGGRGWTQQQQQRETSIITH